MRVALPAGFGRLLFPSFKALRERYPKLAFDLAFDDRMSDPVGEGWDVVVRIGELPTTGELMVRKLCEMQLGLYAAPAYRKRHGVVRSIAELDRHDAIVFRGPSGRLRPWSVLDDGRQREIAPKPALVLTDGQALVDAVVNGFGIAQIHDRVAEPYLRKGVLERVLPKADVPGPPVHAIIALGAKMAPKTRVVLQRLVESLRRPVADA